jgi:hypothetical protein
MVQSAVETGRGQQPHYSEFREGNFIYKLRFAKCKTRRIVSEGKKSFTTVFSVIQNLEKPTWFSKKKIFHFGQGRASAHLLKFLGIIPKNVFFRLFSAKLGPFALRHPAYILNQRRKTLPENVHLFYFCIIREILGEKLGWLIRFDLFKKNQTTFFFSTQKNNFFFTKPMFF